MISARDAYRDLVEGNRRFAEGVPAATDNRSRLSKQADGQSPKAVVLCCSDSRVCPEIIFDQGLGDLFVVRVAGNVASPEVIGSIELAVRSYGVTLIVVLGHTSCGAVATMLEKEQNPAPDLSPSLRSIITRIKASLGKMDHPPKFPSPGELDASAVNQVADCNAYYASEQIAASDALRECESRRQLLMKTATYDLDTGRVVFK